MTSTWLQARSVLLLSPYLPAFLDCSLSGLNLYPQTLAGAEGFEPPSSVLETDSLTVELTPLIFEGFAILPLSPSCFARLSRLAPQFTHLLQPQGVPVHSRAFLLLRHRHMRRDGYSHSAIWFLCAPCASGSACKTSRTPDAQWSSSCSSSSSNYAPCTRGTAMSLFRASYPLILTDSGEIHPLLLSQGFAVKPLSPSCFARRSGLAPQFTRCFLFQGFP